ncbi:MAG TPA: YrhB domain-containing protein [Cytophagaceae bacterium]|jgi:hypothetical protein
MIKFDTAKEIVQKKLDDINKQTQEFVVVIHEKYHEEFDSCWAFYYNTKEYFEIENISASLAGNHPFIVLKKDGRLIETHRIKNIEYYLDRIDRAVLPPDNSNLKLDEL